MRGTRVPAQAVIDNAEDGLTAEQIAAKIYHGLPTELTRQVIKLVVIEAFNPKIAAIARAVSLW